MCWGGCDAVIILRQVEVIETYSGDSCLVTVANYDGDFASDSSYDNYGIIYNGRTEVTCKPCHGGSTLRLVINEYHVEGLRSSFRIRYIFCGDIMVSVTTEYFQSQ